MEISGILIKKTNDRTGTSQGTGATWKRADYILETQEMYQKHICFSVSDGLSGRLATFDAFIGKDVIVTFDIDAKEVNGKWFNNVNAFGIRQKV